jgi:hypothetical protein
MHSDRVIPKSPVGKVRYSRAELELTASERRRYRDGEW